MLYPESFVRHEEDELFADLRQGEDVLVARGGGRLYLELEGVETEGVKLCRMDNKNRRVLNGYLSYTAPTAIGREAASFGLGDRLGVCGPALLDALAGCPVMPVLAQQSLRELTLTNRSYHDVMDSASWAVFKRGWKRGWAADGDHLKHYDDISAAISYGCTMITLDCSDALSPEPKTDAELEERYQKLDAGLREIYEKKYIGNKEAVSLGADFSKRELMSVAVVYSGAAELAKRVYFELIKTADREIDLEVSLDETACTTTYCAHYFVARELADAGAEIMSLAPRFVGEFQKGIDYIGDIAEFSDDLLAHARIAKHFGYKISVHSGSDKFSIFPYVGEHTDKLFHIKTAGTNWLQCIRMIAAEQPQLYRKIHQKALESFDKAAAYYVVHADPAAVPDIGDMKDMQLESLFDNNDCRQLIHITYGFILQDKELHSAIYHTLEEKREQRDKYVSGHIDAHIKALGF
ncbi:MAG: tagaturonate epimerase family protein [Christensenellales bacterium]